VEDSDPLKHDAASLGSQILVFQGNVVSTSVQVQMSQKNARNNYRLSGGVKRANQGAVGESVCTVVSLEEGLRHTTPVQKVSDLWPGKIHLHTWRSAFLIPFEVVSL
jgi:hypothetical protein